MQRQKTAVILLLIAVVMVFSALTSAMFVRRGLGDDVMLTVDVNQAWDEPTAVRGIAALEAMGGRVIYLGGIEQAAVTKVVTNMLAFIHLIAAGEALMLCAKAGVDLRQGKESKSLSLDPLPADRAEPIAYMVSALKHKKQIEGMVALDINVGVNEIVEAAKMSVKSGQAVKLPLAEGSH